jgi:hypothetical protein
MLGSSVNNRYRFILANHVCDVVHRVFPSFCQFIAIPHCYPLCSEIGRRQAQDMKYERPKVLCLGVSYPDIEAQIRIQSGDTTRTAGLVGKAKANVAMAMECVQRGILTQMDGRDLARCLATEERCNVDVYCVSQEKGALYRSDRHLDANFNRASFVSDVQKQFEGCQFDQIILDYFWMPAGWDNVHWRRPFFEQTLINFAKNGILQLSSADSCFDELYRRGIYLPFCFHCFKAIVSHRKELKKFFNISFLRKHELGCLTLWSGTQSIGSRPMQHVLGKRIDQEEVYCSFGPRHIKEMGTGDATTKDLVTLASSLEDFADIRFIVLEPISLEAGSKKTMGSFLGLVNPQTVKRGFRQVESPTPSRQAPLLRAVVTPRKRRSAKLKDADDHRRGLARYNLRHRSPTTIVIPVTGALGDNIDIEKDARLKPKSLFS